MSIVSNSGFIQAKTDFYNKTDKTQDFINIAKILFPNDKENRVFFDAAYEIRALSQNSVSICNSDLHIETENKLKCEKALKKAVLSRKRGVVSLWSLGYDDQPRPARPPQKTPKQLTIGIDTEYEDRSGQNEILSTQLYIDELEMGFVFFHKAAHRTELSTISSLLVEYLQIPVYNKASCKFVFIAHFNLAEFASLSEKGRKELLVYDISTKSYDPKDPCKNIRKSVVSFKPFSLPIRTPGLVKSRMYAKIPCEFRDTILISNTSLRKIGESIGLAKLDIGDEISQMSLLRREDPNAFIEYGIRDAHITASFYREYSKICKNFGLSKIPLTSSALGISYLRKELTFNVFTAAICGTTQLRTRGRRLFNAVSYSPFLEPWKDVYHGGRNECYLRDYDPNTNTFDYDLTNAYPTAMLALGLYDVSKSPLKYSPSTWRKQLKPDDLGYVEIEFKCYDDVVYPPFAYEDPNGKGLIFALSGRIKTTSVELWSALQNNLLQSVKLIDGFYYPSKGSNPLARVISDLITKRNALKRDNPLQAEMMKLIVNSIYGKFAQGLKRTDMPPSAITCPAIAAQITAITRATLCEHLNYIARKYGSDAAISATTDGYFLQQELSETDLNAMKTLPISSIISNARSQNGLGSTIVELKHQGKGFFAMRTRAYGMLQSEKPLFAKGGVKIDLPLSPQNKFKYLQSVALKGCYTEHSLISKSDVLKKGKDLISISKIDKKVLLDLDYKRYPLFQFNSNFVKATTRPYKTISEYERISTIYQKIYSRTEPIFANRNLHATSERFKAFQLFFEISLELPEDYRFTSLKAFLIEAKIPLYENESVRSAAKILGVSHSAVVKWRQQKRIDIRQFSPQLQKLLNSLDPAKLPF